VRLSTLACHPAGSPRAASTSRAGRAPPPARRSPQHGPLAAASPEVGKGKTFGIPGAAPAFAREVGRRPPAGKVLAAPHRGHSFVRPGRRPDRRGVRRRGAGLDQRRQREFEDTRGVACKTHFVEPRARGAVPFQVQADLLHDRVQVGVHVLTLLDHRHDPAPARPGSGSSGSRTTRTRRAAL